MSLSAANGARRIALLGAESTGKTQLADALVRRLERSTGLRTAAVPETLRLWCDRAGRTPRPEEQRGIAEAHRDAIEAAAATHELVVADTTPLMVAIYSDLLFADRSLYSMALEFQRGFDATLVTALDLPWVADGLQRDGPHVRAPVDTALRAALKSAGIAWSLVAGRGPDRVEAALDAIGFALRGGRAGGTQAGLFTRLAGRRHPAGGRTFACRDCDDPDCERLTHRAGAAG